MNHPTEKNVVDIRWGVREGRGRKRRTADINEVRREKGIGGKRKSTYSSTDIDAKIHVL